MMAQVSQVLGQGEDHVRLLATARSLSMHHAVRIEGARGMGKTTVATGLAMALLCESGVPDAACGRCPVCRQVMDRVHPDLFVLAPPEEKDEIPVDAVRELKDRLSRTAMAGRARVVLIEPADALNEQGQNALLKSLEEPGGSTFLLLCTARPEGLLPTITSRSVPLRLVPLPDSVIQAALEQDGIHTETARFVATLAGGALGLAKRLAAFDVVADARRLMQWSLEGQGSAVRLSRELLDGCTGRMVQEERIRTLLVLLRGLARQHLRGHLESVSTEGYCPPPHNGWPARIDAMFEAESDLDLRIPPEQVLTTLLVQLRRATDDLE